MCGEIVGEIAAGKVEAKKLLFVQPRHGVTVTSTSPQHGRNSARGGEPVAGQASLAYDVLYVCSSYQLQPVAAGLPLWPWICDGVCSTLHDLGVSALWTSSIGSQALYRE